MPKHDLALVRPARVKFEDKTLFETVADIACTAAGPSRKQIVDRLLDVKQCNRCGFVECLCGTAIYEEWRKSNS